MFAKSYACRVTQNIWITPTVFKLTFEPVKLFSFKAGQFVSVLVPPTENNPLALKRCYSLSSAPEQSKKEGVYELCVKYVPGGAGSSYLASLREGDTFSLNAPYGEFQYRPVQNGRSICFISTSTGIAPFRSIMLSERFWQAPPDSILNLVGVRTEDEMLYSEEFRKQGIDTHYAVSKPSESYKGFSGRVTDFLKQMQYGRWHTTDFYICGNGDMVDETVKILRGNFGVANSAIIREAFSSKKPNVQVPVQEKSSIVVTIPSLKQVAE